MSRGLSSEPGSREPGLDQLVRALTVAGHPHELAGRDAALAAFRTASGQPRRVLRLTPPNFSARLGAVAAALIVAFAGLTAAAYAKALPAPMQQIAYNLFSPLGVPNSQPVPGHHPLPAPGSAPGLPGPSHPVASSPVSPSAPSSSCPCPTRTGRPTAKGSALALSATRQQLPANGWDLFTGKLTYHDRPEVGARIRLLEQTAGDSSWRQVGNGVTGGHGGVRISVPHVPRNASFQLVGRNGVASPTVTVTVTPRVLLWRAAAQAGTDKLVAAARFGDAGDVVTLQRLSGGSWQSLATQPLGVGHRASFELPAARSGGHYYRVLLQATASHGASVSGTVFEPRTKAAIGARIIEPHPGLPGPGLPGSGKHHHRGIPGPIGPGPVPTPVTPGPVVPGPVVPSPIVPSPIVPTPIKPTPVKPTPVRPGPGMPHTGFLVAIWIMGGQTIDER